MTEKLCRKCETIQPLENFSFKDKAKGKRAAHCKGCHKVWRRNHYEENKEKEYARSREYKRKRGRWVKDFKKDKVCERCGFDNPAALHFHHKDGSDKDFNIGHASTRGMGEQKTLEEIAKCEIICANCHAIEHWG